MDAIDNSLAEILETFPAIWDRTSRSFKDKIAKENSFVQLGRQLKCSAEIVKARYKYLREKFRKEKAIQSSEAKSGSAGSDRDQWHLFHLLQFLEQNIKPRKTHSSLSNTMFNSISCTPDLNALTNYELSDMEDTEMFTAANVTSVLDLNKPCSSRTVSQNYSPTPPPQVVFNPCSSRTVSQNYSPTPPPQVVTNPPESIKQSSSSQNQTPFGKRKSGDKKSSGDYSEILGRLTTVVEESVTKKTKVAISSYDHFGNYVAAELAKLPEFIADDVIVKMNAALYEGKRIARQF